MDMGRLQDIGLAELIDVMLDDAHILDSSFIDK
jgi:hypothetical protein